jgi:predicted metal-binding membrane protein
MDWSAKDQGSRRGLTRDRRSDEKGMTVPVNAALEVVVRRDQLFVVSVLTTVIALSWAYLLAGAGTGMSTFEMTRISLPGMAGGMRALGCLFNSGQSGGSTTHFQEAFISIFLLDHAWHWSP